MSPVPTTSAREVITKAPGTFEVHVAELLRAKAPAETVPVLLTYLPVADSEAVEEEAMNTIAILGVKDGKVDKVLEEALADKSATWECR